MFGKKKANGQIRLVLFAEEVGELIVMIAVDEVGFLHLFFSLFATFLCTFSICLCSFQLLFVNKESFGAALGNSWRGKLAIYFIIVSFKLENCTFIY